MLGARSGGLVLDGAEFAIDEGRPLAERPRLALLDLDVSPTRTPEEHERHLLDTFGCGDWITAGEEELRFSSRDLGLVSAWLSVPVARQEDETSETPQGWAGRTVVRGRLTARERAAFRIPPTVSRSCEVDGDALACFVAGDVAADAERLGVEVAEGLELLFADGRYAGWLLRAPETALGQGAPAGDRDAALMAWLAAFYTLTDDEIIAAIELDEDREALDRLRALRDEIDASDDPWGGRQALRSYLSTWIETLDDLIS